MLHLALVGAVLLVAVLAAPAVADVFNGRTAFTSARDGGDFDIFTMTAGGEDLRLLTSNTRNDHRPDWHPSGPALAFRVEVARRFRCGGWEPRARSRRRWSS
jgi:Tol biopolymer transport system component